jgi:GAF domain-containing protein
MRIEPAALAKSIGTLTTLDVAEGFPEALQQVVDAAKLLFGADGAGLMLVGEDELLTWASASDARAERAEAVQAQLGAGPCMVAWQQRGPVAVRDVGAESRWSGVAPALVAAQLRAALSVPVQLVGGPIGTLEVYAAGPRDWNDSEVAALQAYAGVVASLLRAAAAARVKGELAEQLQWALQHRVLVEQAKGVLMEREGLSPAAAFERLRATARAVGRTVGELAGIVLAGGSLPHRPPSGQPCTRPFTEHRRVP